MSRRQRHRRSPAGSHPDRPRVKFLWLIERNPVFIEECRQIRERMRQGEYVSFEDALKRFQSDP